MVNDASKQTLIDVQVDDFRKQAKFFGSPLATRSIDLKTLSYGDEHPELQKFAICILCLTYSSFGCERNWSSFKMVHTKGRNMLNQNTMNDVVFVMANSKLDKKKKTRKPIELNLDHCPFDDEWIMEDEHSLDIDNLDLDENLVPVQVGEDENEITVTAPPPLDDLDITNLNGEGDGIGKDGVEDLLSNYDFNLQDYILYRDLTTLYLDERGSMPEYAEAQVLEGFSRKYDGCTTSLSK
ncbi:hypothetical protein CR513_01166, partial [Mucuna pruriens]